MAAPSSATRACSDAASTTTSPRSGLSNRCWCSGSEGHVSNVTRRSAARPFAAGAGGPARPPPTSHATASPRATASTRATVAASGGCCSSPAAQPAADRPGRQRRRARRPGPGRRWGRRPADSSSSSSASAAQVVGLAGEDARRRRARRWRRAAGAARGGPGCDGSGGRRSTGRARAGCPRSAHSLCVSRRRSARSGRRGGVVAGQPVEAGAAEQVEEHGLGLVVGGVAGEHVGGQRRVAGPAGPRLEVGAGRHASPAPTRKAAPNRAATSATTSASARRAGPQAVVDVDGGDRAAGLDREHEQRQRVGAAGDRAGDGGAGRRERAAGQQVRRGRRHGSRTRSRLPAAEQAEQLGDVGDARACARRAGGWRTRSSGSCRATSAAALTEGAASERLEELALLGGELAFDGPAGRRRRGGAGRRRRACSSRLSRGRVPLGAAPPAALRSMRARLARPVLLRGLALLGLGRTARGRHRARPAGRPGVIGLVR